MAFRRKMSWDDFSETYFISHKADTIMAGAEDKAVVADSNEVALQEFEAGVRRSIKQAGAGLVKTFKTKEEFLKHLKNLE